jgi:AcrR family transcriptional regulator
MAGARTPRDLRSDAVRNREVLLRAATAAFHREGLRVRMGTIAADAEVGIGTLYRHFPTRERLLDELSHRSYLQVLENARSAERRGTDAIDCLRLFVEAAIGQRNELVLALHGGPEVTAPETEAVRAEIRREVQRMIDRGIADGVVRAEIGPDDVILFGAMLAQPGPVDPDRDAMHRRLLDTYLRGIRRTP